MQEKWSIHTAVLRELIHRVGVEDGCIWFQVPVLIHSGQLRQISRRPSTVQIGRGIAWPSIFGLNKYSKKGRVFKKTKSASILRKACGNVQRCGVCVSSTATASKQSIIDLTCCKTFCSEIPENFGEIN